MAKEKVIVTIGPEGQMDIDVKGVKGKGCTGLAKALADQVGTVVRQQKTSEYFEAEVQTITKVNSQ